MNLLTIIDLYMKAILPNCVKNKGKHCLYKENYFIVSGDVRNKGWQVNAL